MSVEEGLDEVSLGDGADVGLGDLWGDEVLGMITSPEGGVKMPADLRQLYHG